MVAAVHDTWPGRGATRRAVRGTDAWGQGGPRSVAIGGSGARERPSGRGPLVSNLERKRKGAARERLTGGPRVSGSSSPSRPHMARSAEVEICGSRGKKGRLGDGGCSES
jgi:hypothetical protein